MYLSLALTTILWAFLYYYLSNIFPGKFGTPKPFYFIFLPSFYKANQPNCIKTNQTFPNEAEDINDMNIVRVEELTKIFQTLPFTKKKTAVNNTSFNLQKNQITILLGHNGAGKTTTMMMMVGIVPPTSGRIVVEGEDDVQRYRHTLGYCPQNDVFIRYMNCEEHLLLFGRLRGLSSAEAKAETKIILEKVRLRESEKKAASELSSGMKRRLCLASAVIGQTK